nr:MAG TPA: hypothetical protein [Caudoviricetes sp.]
MNISFFKFVLTLLLEETFVGKVLYPRLDNSLFNIV